MSICGAIVIQKSYLLWGLPAMWQAFTFNRSSIALVIERNAKIRPSTNLINAIIVPNKSNWTKWPIKLLDLFSVEYFFVSWIICFANDDLKPLYWLFFLNYFLTVPSVRCRDSNEVATVLNMGTYRIVATVFERLLSSCYFEPLHFVCTWRSAQIWAKLHH